jgi:hypothetical protein
MSRPIPDNHVDAARGAADAQLALSRAADLVSDRPEIETLLESLSEATGVVIELLVPSKP